MSTDLDDWGYEDDEVISWKSTTDQKWPYVYSRFVDHRIAVRHVTGEISVWTMSDYFVSAPDGGASWCREIDGGVTGIEQGSRFSPETMEYADISGMFEGVSQQDIEKTLTPDEARYGYEDHVEEKNGQKVIFRTKVDKITGKRQESSHIFFTTSKSSSTHKNDFFPLLKKYALQLIGR